MTPDSNPVTWLAEYRWRQRTKRRIIACLTVSLLFAVGGYIDKRLRLPEPPTPPVIAYQPLLPEATADACWSILGRCVVTEPDSTWCSGSASSLTIRNLRAWSNTQ